MRDGWEMRRLGEVLQKTKTVNPKLKPVEKFTYLDVSSVNKETKLIEKTTILLGKDAPSRARKLVETDDIIFATVRPTHSRVAIITKEYNNQVCSTGYYVLKAKKYLNNHFVFYFLLTYGFNKKMESMQKGASYPAVTNKEVERVFIPFPKSIKEQQRIVAILDKAFAAIDKAKAKAEQNLINAKELFESYLQNIFENKGDDWEEKTFKELSSKIGDGLHGTPKYDESGDYYFINGNNLNDGTIEIKVNTKKVNKEEFEKYKKELTNNTVLISINGTLGKVAFYNEEPVVLGKSACYINFNDEVNKHYIKYLVKSPLFFKNMSSLSTGATIKNFSLKSMRSYTLLLPPILRQEQIVKKIDALQAETKKLEIIYQQKLDDLEELKKSILQKAFNGEL